MQDTWLIFIAVAGAIFFSIEAIRFSINPESGKELFMKENGFSISIVAKAKFLGEPAEARRAIVENKSIQRAFVAELWGRVLIILF
jgi:hypothetical protein